MYCKNCGQLNADYAKFCRNCGTPLAAPETPAAPAPAPAQPQSPPPAAPARPAPAAQGRKDDVVAVCRPHWVGYIGNILAAVILAVAGIVCSRYSPIIPIAALVVAAVLIIGVVIRLKSTYLKLTETRIVGHVGFINSKTLSTPLSRVQHIGLSNGLGGKILGYHTITVSDAGSGATEYKFHKMAGARAFVDAAQERMY